MIVPKELFDRVQDKLEKNKKAPARHKSENGYLLTTRLFCGYCGTYLCGESGTSRTGHKQMHIHQEKAYRVPQEACQEGLD